MGHQVAHQYTPELNKVSGHWVVISDTNEVPSSLLTPSVVDVLKISNSYLRLIHVSDNMPTPTDNRAHLSDCGIRIQAKLPAFGRLAITMLDHHLMNRSNGEHEGGDADDL